MKLLLLIIAAGLFFSCNLFAAYPSRPKAPVGVPDFLRVENFLKMTPRQFEKESGHKLGLIQKMYFRKLQRQLSKTKYNSDSDLLNYYDVQKAKFRLDHLWFVVGCIIGPFGLLFAYTTREKSRSKYISALLGFGVFIIWFGFIFLF